MDPAPVKNNRAVAAVYVEEGRVDDPAGQGQADTELTHTVEKLGCHQQRSEN